MPRQDKFDGMVGESGLDSFKAFTVEYTADGSEKADTQQGKAF